MNMMNKILGIIGVLLMILGALAFFGALIYSWIMLFKEADNWLTRMIIISGGAITIGLICGFISVHKDL